MRRHLATLVCAATLLTPMFAEAFSLPFCWCDPRKNWQDFSADSCNTNWEVVHTGLHGFVSICSGSPPDCVGLVLSQPPLVTGEGYILLFGGGFQSPRGIPCIPNVDFGTPISIWPNLLVEIKKNLRSTLMDSYRLLVALQAELRSMPEGSPLWRGQKMFITNVATQLADLVMVARDPANPDYAHTPALVTFPTLPPLVAEVDLTPAQADALNAWAVKSRKLTQITDQFNRTQDNFSGAILAHQAGDANAAPWVRRLARSLDALAVGISGKGYLELGARGAIAAAYPAASIAATCMTVPELTSQVMEMSQIGANALNIMVYQSDIQDSGGLCIPDTAWPAVLTAGSAETATAYGTLATATHAAQAACDELSVCSSLTTTTLTLLPSPPGKLKLQVAVVASDGPYTTGQYAGLTVEVSAPGLVGKTVTLVNGAGPVTLTAPAGTYLVTASFPEQKQAKLGASAAMLTAVAP